MNSNQSPLVSICCLTFNHEGFIRQTIESFLMQKTDFVFEILIHDDASTDNTAVIIKEYSDKYPDIIKPIIQSENQYSKGIHINSSIQFPRALGKYIAICEGDDYWTDPLKLQKQVAFLDKNEDVSLCFHNTEVLFEQNSVNDRGLKIIKEDRVFDPSEIIKFWIIPTASVMFRRALLDDKYKITAQNKNFMYGDIILFLSLAEKGELFGQSDFMSVYRRHEGGVTNVSLNIKHYQKRIRHFEEIIKVFGTKYKDYVSDFISYSYTMLFILNLKNGTVTTKGFKRIFSNDFVFILKALKSKLFQIK